MFLDDLMTIWLKSRFIYDQDAMRSAFAARIADLPAGLTGMNALTGKVVFA
jgi:hypothetical protein